ncbi:hypothetical protein AMK59_3326, partial [Oryctes borbonicus]
IAPHVTAIPSLKLHDQIACAHLEVRCAYEENKFASSLVFQHICPSDYNIRVIKPIKSNRKPYCRWQVEYIFTDATRSYAGGNNAAEVWRELSRAPSDARIISRKRVNDNTLKAWQIEYGVQPYSCKCLKDFQFELTQPARGDEAQLQ